MKMQAAQLIQYLEPTLSDAGFTLDEVQDDITYGDRPAWAIYYRGSDCKLQVCWSSRTGGLNFMLAPIGAPNEFGLSNISKQWHYMLLLSTAHDDLKTPGVDAGAEADMAWLKALFGIHYASAHEALLVMEKGRRD